MDQTLKPIRFSHHALALVSSSAIIGTVFSGLLLIVIAIVYMFTIKPVPQEVIIIVPLLWLTVTALTFGIMIIPLTLVWPVTKKGTNISVFICSIIGAISLVYVISASRGGVSFSSMREILTYAFFGALIGTLYMVLAMRFHRRGGAKRQLITTM